MTPAGAALETLDVAPPDLDADVVYLPVRHHSPACARHVRAVIERVRPTEVLIEGPRDADPLIALLQDERTEPPIALYATVIERRQKAGSRHYASYYPLCAYSPEFVAMRVAVEVGGLRARFIDLTYAETIRASPDRPDRLVGSLQSEAHLRYSRFLAAAARRAGVRDADELWDHLFESGAADGDSRAFFHGVLTYCAIARQGDAQELLARNGTLAREEGMAHEIAQAREAGAGRIVVVTGGFHTVALPGTTPRAPRPLPAKPPIESGVTLMRYRFEHLDRLNGYAAGMPSPEFYQRRWDGVPAVETVVALARELRGGGGEPSPADAIGAAHQLEALAALRGHREPTREDLLDAVRSAFVKGSIDVEGVRVMVSTRRFLAGARMGAIPPEAGRPPLVLDFERKAETFGFDLTRPDSSDLVLDLYRSARHRRTSRFLHALALLDVTFAELRRGPDYVRGRAIGRIQEGWRYLWQPATESALIEASRWGSSVEEAAAARLVEAFREAEHTDGRADVAAQFVIEAARCGLAGQLEDFVRRTTTLVAQDADFISVARACARLLLVAEACDPLEMHGDEELRALAAQTWDRAAYVMPSLVNTPEANETVAIEALIGWRECVDGCAADDADGDARRVILAERLATLVGDPAANPTCAGAAGGLLHGDGAWNDATLAEALGGRLERASVDGARFLTGLLAVDRACGWRCDALIARLHDHLREVDEETFLRMCPHLRLAFSALAPHETDRVAQRVASLGGGDAAAVVGANAPVSEEEVLLARRVDGLVRASLAEDGLEVTDAGP